MSNHAIPASTQPPPPRRHQLSRSITDASSTLRSHRHHLHPQRRHQDCDETIPQSATPILQIPRGSIDLPRSEGVTPYLMSADQSRRISMLPPSAKEMGALAAPAPARREDQMHQEKERAASRAVGLKKSLLDLNALSNETTRRLDNTYYGILEKSSMLQNTILAIKELAGMWQDTKEDFKSDSRGLVMEIDAQLDAFGHFDDQQERIESLQSRIMTGRQKAQKLSERVDLVQARIEGWAKADKEWQEKTRKRLKVIWLFTSATIFVLVLVFLGAQYAAVDVSKVVEVSSIKKYSGSPVEEALTNHSAHLSEDVKAAMNRIKGEKRNIDEEVLRGFDEL